MQKKKPQIIAAASNASDKLLKMGHNRSPSPSPNPNSSPSSKDRHRVKIQYSDDETGDNLDMTNITCEQRTSIASANNLLIDINNISKLRPLKMIMTHSATISDSKLQTAASFYSLRRVSRSASHSPRPKWFLSYVLVTLVTIAALQVPALHTHDMNEANLRNRSTVLVQQNQHATGLEAPKTDLKTISLDTTKSSLGSKDSDTLLSSASLATAMVLSSSPQSTAPIETQVAAPAASTISSDHMLAADSKKKKKKMKMMKKKKKMEKKHKEWKKGKKHKKKKYESKKKKGGMSKKKKG